jgi:hypothetical protein
MEMEARLGFSTLSKAYRLKPLDAYPFPVFEAIQAAALADVRKIRDRILEGERLASLGEDVETGGWEEDRERPASGRQPGSGRFRRVRGASVGVQGLHDGRHQTPQRKLVLSSHDLVSFLVLMIGPMAWVPGLQIDPVDPAQSCEDCLALTVSTSDVDGRRPVLVLLSDPPGERSPQRHRDHPAPALNRADRPPGGGFSSSREARFP